MDALESLKLFRQEWVDGSGNFNYTHRAWMGVDTEVGRVLDFLIENMEATK